MYLVYYSLGDTTHYLIGAYADREEAYRVAAETNATVIDDAPAPPADQHEEVPF